jgi:hypothetical protein
MTHMTPSRAIVLVALALVLLYVSWTMWQPVWRDWAMATRGVTVLATVTDVIPVPGGDESGVHWALITVPRTDGTSIDGRVRGWPGHRFAVGDQPQVRYHPTGRIEPRLVDRWRWKAAAASLTAHIVMSLLALGTSLVGIGMIVRAAMDVRL